MTTKNFTNISPEQLTKPKIELGQVYLHVNSGELYIVSKASQQYSLICLNDGLSYAGLSHKVEDVFDGCQDLFLLVKELDIKYKL